MVRRSSRRPLWRIFAGSALGVGAMAAFAWFAATRGEPTFPQDDEMTITLPDASPALAADVRAVDRTARTAGASTPPAAAAAESSGTVIETSSGAAPSESHELAGPELPAPTGALAAMQIDERGPSEPAQTPASRPAPPDAAGDLTAGRVRDQTVSGNPRLQAGRRLLESGAVLEARNELNAVLRNAQSPEEQREARALLTRAADETLFTKRLLPNDPLVDTAVIEPGDVLVNIAKRYDTTAEALMVMNGITNPRTIRAGQRLKAPKAAFRAEIDKSEFRLDVYLGEQYVRSYRVGLGSDHGTPEGVWRVRDRLENPTYYPSASAPEKRIMPPDDPNNPLGEFWVGLEGIEGAAVGQEGFGIHGTIEPESIGKAVSLGCIRMHNEDVGFLFKLMTPGKSTVAVRP